MTDVFLMLIVLILAAAFVLLGRIDRKLISRDKDDEPLKKFGGRNRENCVASRKVTQGGLKRGKWHERWERADE